MLAWLELTSLLTASYLSEWHRLVLIRLMIRLETSANHVPTSSDPPHTSYWLIKNLKTHHITLPAKLYPAALPFPGTKPILVCTEGLDMYKVQPMEWISRNYEMSSAIIQTFAIEPYAQYKCSKQASQKNTNTSKYQKQKYTYVFIFSFCLDFEIALSV